MEITISTNEETNKQTAIVQFNVPMRIHLCGERSLKEYKRIVLENLRNDSSTIFELLEYLSMAAENRDIGFADFCGITNVLSGIGKGLQEAIEIVEMDYNRKIKATEESSTIVESTSSETPNEQPEINQRFARYLSEILSHPDTPEQLIEGIQDGLTEFHNYGLDQTKLDSELTSPEYIERLFNMAKK
jgi:hypothetical protein